MKKTKNSGQSLIEFAITMPLLLLLVMGVFDLGRGIYYFSAIQNAAREGARYGAVNQCDTNGIKNAAKLMAVGLGDSLEVKDPIMYYTHTGRADRIVVTVEYTFETVTPLVGVFLGDDGSILLRSQARQLIENAAGACP
jgi:hypothetical protein